MLSLLTVIIKKNSLISSFKNLKISNELSNYKNQ